jgi:hypothetical protein
MFCRSIQQQCSVAGNVSSTCLGMVLRTSTARSASTITRYGVYVPLFIALLLCLCMRGRGHFVSPVLGGSLPNLDHKSPSLLAGVWRCATSTARRASTTTRYIVTHTLCCVTHILCCSISSDLLLELFVERCAPVQGRALGIRHAEHRHTWLALLADL